MPKDPHNGEVRLGRGCKCVVHGFHAHWASLVELGLNHLPPALQRRLSRAALGNSAGLGLIQRHWRGEAAGLCCPAVAQPWGDKHEAQCVT